MLDILFTALDNYLTYGVNKDWGQSIPIGGEEPEAWANSSHDLVFGDQTSWTIGLGNTTNTFGPRIDFNVDYSYFIKNIGKKIGAKAGALFIGTTGFFTLTFGPETHISYGATDLSLQRKKHADQAFEIVADENGSSTPKSILAINILCTGVIATAAILARINHYHGFFGKGNLEAVNKVNKGLNDAAKIIQPRYLAFLTVMELAFHAREYLNTLIVDLATIPSYIKNETTQTIIEAKNRVSAVLNKYKPFAETKASFEKTKRDVNIRVDYAFDKVKNQIQFIGSVIDSFQAKRANWYETNQKYSLSCKEYSLSASGGWDSIPFNTGSPGKISLNSVSNEYDTKGKPTKINSSSDIQINSDSINMKVVEKGTQNKSSIVATKAEIILESNQVYLKSPDNGSDINTIGLTNNCIDIQCGTAATGPSLKMNGGKDIAIMSVGTEQLGKSLSISKDSIEIGNIGAAQILLPRITISGTDIVISAGISTIELTATGIGIKCGETKLDLNPTTIKELSTIIERRSLLRSKIIEIMKKIDTMAIAMKKHGLVKY